jgi:two-component system phosphate regulon sensor histidine kinase PhoR
MKRAIFTRLVLLTVIVVCVCGILSAIIFAIETEGNIKNWLTRLTLSTAKTYEKNPSADAAELSQAVGVLRVTIIAENGKVLSDSSADASGMESHAERDEVKNAMRNSVYTSVHRSVTLGKNFIYASTKTADGTVIRLADSYPGILSAALSQFPAVGIAMLIALILSLIIARQFSSAVARPLEKVARALWTGDFETLNNYKSNYYEVDRALQTIRQLLGKLTSDKQKQDYLTGASHELKTPLTSILGFSEMLSSGAIKDGAEKDAAIKRIEGEAKKMSVLIDDILTISNLEAELDFSKQTNFDFADAAREAIEIASGLGEQNKIKIEANIKSVEIRANKKQISELCANLIENAIKYNKPGGVVRVKLSKKDGFAVLTVEDDGIGISSENQIKAFDKFYRGETARARKIPGTGLGLSIVKSIAELYKGEVSLESREGLGTKVKVTLPLSDK